MKPMLKPGTSTGAARHERDVCRRLREGRLAVSRVAGTSMAARLLPGDHLTLAPCHTSRLTVGDIVFVRVQNRRCVHQIVEIRDGRLLIGTPSGVLDGWVATRDVLGLVIRVVRGGQVVYRAAQAPR